MRLAPSALMGGRCGLIGSSATRSHRIGRYAASWDRPLRGSWGSASLTNMAGIGGNVNVALGALVLVVLVVAIVVRRRRRRGAPQRRHIGSIGPAAAGAFYELLNEERRNAIQIVIEDKAGYRDPEDAEGDLPKLAKR